MANWVHKTPLLQLYEFAVVIGTSIQLLSHKNTCRFEDTVHLSQFLVIHTETHLTDDMMTLKVVFVV